MKDWGTSNEPRDTSPLELDQLSDDELAVILEIEQRLREAQATASQSPKSCPKSSSKHHLAVAQVRHPRVLLVDGGRGTGKTSLLLTMAHHWNCSLEKFSDPCSSSSLRTEHPSEVAALPPIACDGDRYKKRADRIKKEKNLAINHAEPPDFVRVIGRILDFDSLPSTMPLVAGIVQAWKRLAEDYDEASDSPYGAEQTLTDLWHELFGVAVAGWGNLPDGRGLVEQVLDREEQIENWHCLDARWQYFINQVVQRGRCLKSSDHHSSEPVFVVMIDDVDLQVERISELLPALRLLYHPNVVFLVAADREHMIDMLKLDFLGQQNKLAGYRPGSGVSLDAAEQDRYATRLAESTVEKVFQKRNQWKLKRLSLRDILDFPRDGSKTGAESFREILGKLSRTKEGNPLDETEKDHQIESVAEFFEKMARAVDGFDFPGITTFRGAQQLYHHVQGRKGKSEEEAVARSEKQLSIRALAGLLGGKDDAGATAEEPVSMPIYGELGAAFQPTLVVPGVGYSVLLSARPDFIFSEFTGAPPRRMLEDRQGQFDFLPALAAKALEELNFPVEAAGLRWENYLSLAWTEWKKPTYLPFAWDVFRHPRPDEILRWAKDWQSVIRTAHLEFRDRYRFDRYMFAWIYYQRIWNDLAEPDDDLLGRILTDREQQEVDFSPVLDSEDNLKERLQKKLGRLGESMPDAELASGDGEVKGKNPSNSSDGEGTNEGKGANAKPAKNATPGKEAAETGAVPTGSSQEEVIAREVKEWRETTLPLLARPELGISPPAQRQILEHCLSEGAALEEHQEKLRNLRRRKVADALYAAGLQKNATIEQNDEDSIVKAIDRSYARLFTEKENHWRQIEDTRTFLTQKNDASGTE